MHGWRKQPNKLTTSKQSTQAYGCTNYHLLSSTQCIVICKNTFLVLGKTGEEAAAAAAAADCRDLSQWCHYIQIPVGRCHLVIIRPSMTCKGTRCQKSNILPNCCMGENFPTVFRKLQKVTKKKKKAKKERKKSCLEVAGGEDGCEDTDDMGTPKPE